jgi:transposase
MFKMVSLQKIYYICFCKNKIIKGRLTMEQISKIGIIKKVINEAKDYKEYFKGISIYVGVDVHLKSWFVTIYVRNILYKSFSISPPSSEQLINYLKEHYPGGDFHVVYEAGFSGFGLYDDLIAAGMECIVVSPADVPMSDKDKRFKTDRHDSKNLALQLKSGSLEGVNVPDVDLREYRALLRLRSKLVKDRTRTKNYTKSNLMFFGKEIKDEEEDCIKSWSKEFFRLLSEVNYTTAEGKMVMERQIKIIQFYDEQVKEIDKEIKELSNLQRFNEDVKILSSVPGISTLSAMVFLVEIGDFNRFADTHHLKSYVGLIPNEHSSGEREIKTGITRRGNKFLKKIIIEASWIAIKKDISLLNIYTKAKKRMPGTRAIILVASSLLNRIRSIMHQRVSYKIAV